MSQAIRRILMPYLILEWIMEEIAAKFDDRRPPFMDGLKTL